MDPSLRDLIDALGAMCMYVQCHYARLNESGEADSAVSSFVTGYRSQGISTGLTQSQRAELDGLAGHALGIVNSHPGLVGAHLETDFVDALLDLRSTLSSAMP